MTHMRCLLANPITLALLLNASVLGAEPRATASDWFSYGRDTAGTGFSPLTQITRNNVRDLRIAWTYHMRPADVAEAAPADYLPSEATPLVIDGVMYLPTPYGEVVALDADTGIKLWNYRLTNSDQPSTRGVAYWAGDHATPPRIVFGTRSGKLISLVAATGAPAADFGNDGVVDMKTPEVMNGFTAARMAMSSPPLVFRDLVITGSRTQEFPMRGASGDVRAWDARSGKLVWTFHTVPHPGELGHDTWEGDSWKHRSGVNIWTSPVADLERGIVYLPLAAPAFDRWGGDRKGANLFGNSVVAVDGKTGKYLWHFQTVHHDLWDLDLPSVTLIDVKQGRRTVPAIAVANKNAMLFLLDRVTGRSIYGVKEVPVPAASEIPGEEPWPTQPVPVKPEPLARLTFQMSELVDLTPQLKERCARLVKEWNIVESRVYEPPRSTAAVPHFPGGQGGMNWGGSAFDPASGYFITKITNMASAVQLAQQPDGSWNSAHGYRYFWDARSRIPCQRPPWGELVAVDVNTGDIAWRRTLGVTDSLPEGLRDTGRPGAGGAIATAGGLIFVGATDDNRLRAFDSSTGELRWEARLPASVYGTPMTYQGRSGRQFVAAVNTGGMTGSAVTNDEVTVFALHGNRELPDSHSARTCCRNQAGDDDQAARAGGEQASIPVSPPLGAGLELIDQRCVECHPATQIFSAPRKTPVDWARTVKEMAARGAELTPEEIKTISDYLARHFSADTARADRTDSPERP